MPVFPGQLVWEDRPLAWQSGLILGFPLIPYMPTNELSFSYFGRLSTHSAMAACRGDHSPRARRRLRVAWKAGISARMGWPGPWSDCPAKDQCFGSMEGRAQSDNPPATPSPDTGYQSSKWLEIGQECRPDLHLGHSGVHWD